ncbi:MAG: ferrous-iron efflux pump FieF [Phenylobacterium sp.]|jgi:ferrous-iron efflux pump FieF
MGITHAPNHRAYMQERAPERAQYERLVKAASWAPLVAVSILIICKIYAWVMTGSASIMATLTDSILDIAASGISFFVIRYALEPADNEHRFGHGKAESLAGLAQAAFICGSSVLLIFHSVSRLDKSAHIEHFEIGLWVAAFSIVVTLILVIFQNWILKQTNSVAIKADSLHYKGDLLLNAAVFLAIWLAHEGIPYVDAVFAILIAAYLLYNAWLVARQSAESLMDTELSDEEHERILQIALSHPQVSGVHEFRTREAGHTKFIQMHLEMDDNLTLYQAHLISEEVEVALAEQFGNVDVIIHEDPESQADKRFRS